MEVNLPLNLARLVLTMNSFVEGYEKGLGF